MPFHSQSPHGRIKDLPGYSYDDVDYDTMLDVAKGRRFKGGMVLLKAAEPTQYGVFVWTEENRYPEKNAIKIFKSKVIAQKFADKNIDKGYVVRPIWSKTAMQIEKPWTDAYQTPAQGFMQQPLRSRRDYGEIEMEIGKRMKEASVSNVFKAPEKVHNPDNLQSVFLAGAIDMGSASDWQQELTDYLKDVSCIILNPRRKNWDSSWVQSIENDQFREQVEWELNGMEMANLIVLCLTKDSKAPISLLEMGLHASDGKMIVFCPDGFYRKGNVDVVCNRYNVPVFEDFDEFKAKVKELMSKPIVQSKGENGMVIKAADQIAKRIMLREFISGMRLADVSINSIQDLIGFARKNRWMKSMGHHEEMVRQLEANPEYRKIVLDADKKHEDPKDPTDRKWFRTMVEISRNHNIKTAGMGYGWGVRYNDELETNEANMPHLELPQYPIQRSQNMSNRMASAFKIGDYIMQPGRDSNTYALVIGEQVNGGSKVISIQEWRGVAVIDSTKGWHPEPVKVSKEDIPDKLLKKIERKFNELPKNTTQAGDNMKAINANATENYVKQIRQVWKLVEELETTIEKHEQRQEKKPNDYGFAGDMEYVVKELSDLITFIGSGRKVATEVADLVRLAKELVSENTGLGLDGMTKMKAARIVNNLIRPYTKGNFTDTYWEPVSKIWKALSDANINWELGRADYLHGQNGKTSGKEWKFKVYFRNNNQNFTTLYGVIIASWAGSVADPSDKYDLVAYCS